MYSNALVIFILLYSLTGFAQEKQRPVIYKDSIVPFTDWIAKSPNEAQILNLFPGYKEPTVDIVSGGAHKQKLLKMVMYLTRAKAIAKRGAVNINLASLISEQSIKTLDPEARHKRISAAETMPAVAGRGNINNFKWCNKNSANPDIFLPGLERNLSHLTRPQTPWCAANSKTVCYETCRLLPERNAITSAIAAYNQVKSPGKDFGIATQSEARYFTSEGEFGAKFPLSSLTGVKTQVSGILEISIFYFDQVMLYGKYILILQADPSDAQKTILTGLAAFGMRSDAWNHPIGGGRLQALLKSNSVMNAPTGILAGIPDFSRNAIIGFAELVEK